MTGTEAGGSFLYRSLANTGKKDNKFPWIEFPVFSTSRFVGSSEDDAYPIKAMNLIGSYDEEYGDKLLIRLHYWIYRDETSEQNWSTQTSSYHGKWIEEEVAAIISSFCFCQARAGAITREYLVDHYDELGWPRRLEVHPQQPAKRPDRGIKFPVDCDLGQALSFIENQFSRLNPEKSAILIKSLRSFQDALWISGEDQNISFLLLCAAVESAANYWYIHEMKSQAGDADLSVLAPEVYQKFNLISPEAVVAASEILLPLYKSSAKFTKFLVEFVENTGKPTGDWSSIQIDRSRAGIREVARSIYNLRSKALHTGTPFPYVMYQKPVEYGNKDGKGIFNERPLGLAAGAMGGRWDQADMPINLHYFAKMVQEALISWSNVGL